MRIIILLGKCNKNLHRHNISLQSQQKNGSQIGCRFCLFQSKAVQSVEHNTIPAKVDTVFCAVYLHINKIFCLTTRDGVQRGYAGDFQII